MAEPNPMVSFSNGRTSNQTFDRVVVKRNGWVVCISEIGETAHFPPHAVDQITGEVSYE